MSREGVRQEERGFAVRLTRRGFLKLGGAGLVGAALLGVAGCGGDGRQGGGGQGGGGGGDGGNSLVVGIDQEPAVLNRMLGEGQLQVTNDTTAGIVEAPLAVQPDLSYKPRLAEAMPEVVSEDPLVIEYRLREGLTWSDGEPLTSADARWTYEQIVNPDNQIALRTGWQDIGEFATPDERTVRITFEQPYAPWRNLLTENYPILPRHVYEGKDFNKAMNSEIVGSGPFKFDEWRKGQSLTVVRNENYWGEKPALESVTYRFITDTNTLIASLQSGEVSFINPPPDIGLQEKLDGIEGAKNESAAGVVWEYIGINVEKVSNKKMRQALAYGINRQQIVDEILQGSVNPLQSVIMPQQKPYYEPAWERYSYDPDRARQLAGRPGARARAPPSPSPRPPATRCARPWRR